MTNFLNEKQYDSYYKSLPYESRSSVVWIFFIDDHDHKMYLKEWKDWLSVQDYCRKNKCNIDCIGLRYKGNEAKIEIPIDAQGVYLIKSARGQIGMESKATMTVGIIDQNIVHKTHYLLPELIEDLKFKDNIETCHEPAIVYNEQKREAKVIQ